MSSLISVYHIIPYSVKGINTILHIHYTVIGIKKITISYTEDQYEWLENHPEINKSGVFRKAISYMMKNGSSSLSESDLEIISREVGQGSQ